MSAAYSRLQENLDRVRQRMATAAARSGRDPNAIRLVAVTKYAPSEIAQLLVQLGCHDLGESRPQELWRKAEAVRHPDLRWHLIGHLQRNKVRRTLPWLHLLHSADSLELLDDIETHSTEHPANVLVEINTSGDTTKHGLMPDEAATFIEHALRLPHVKLRGLMTMAAREGDLRCARENFAALRELRDDLQRAFGTRLALDELSMGMTADFEVAIEEGSTIVRVGSALFEGVTL
jgi:pyridoxal phosphate enzyme (YggS family)